MNKLQYSIELQPCSIILQKGCWDTKKYLRVHRISYNLDLIGTKYVNKQLKLFFLLLFDTLKN